MAGEVILVPIRQNLGDLESIYTLTPVASKIWKHIDSKNTLEQILNIIFLDFQVNAKRAKSDLLRLIGKLEKVSG